MRGDGFILHLHRYCAINRGLSFCSRGLTAETTTLQQQEEAGLATWGNLLVALLYHSVINLCSSSLSGPSAVLGSWARGPSWWTVQPAGELPVSGLPLQKGLEQTPLIRLFTCILMKNVLQKETKEWIDAKMVQQCEYFPIWWDEGFF